jgi:hypothetical protein
MQYKHGVAQLADKLEQSSMIRRAWHLGRVAAGSAHRTLQQATDF